MVSGLLLQMVSVNKKKGKKKGKKKRTKIIVDIKVTNLISKQVCVRLTTVFQ